MILLLLSLALLAFAIYLAWLFRYLYSKELPQKWQISQPFPRPGIWFCAHRAKRWIPFQHMYLKITPTDPSWAGRYPLVFTCKDSMGAAYCTMGAGPVLGKLKLDFNRPHDLEDPISFEEKVFCGSVEQENGWIATLLTSAGRYKSELDFRAIPRLGKGYNCNSLITALAHRAGFELPGFTRIHMLCVGIGSPVPEEKFSGESAMHGKNI